MRVIGVMDLMGGVVVRAVAGRRGDYRPLVTPLCDGAMPQDVARGLVDKAGIRELYVADLDAIAGLGGHLEVVTALGGLVETLWIDMGLSDARRVPQLRAIAAAVPARVVIVLALESIRSRSSLLQLVGELNQEHVAFSLDLYAGRPLTKCRHWQHTPPLEIAREVLRRGVCRFVVLDLNSVGMFGGCPTLELCRQLRALEGALEIVSGGGIRDVADLAALEAAGCDAALVASALHSGALGPIGR